ncbi:rubisco methyltransferase family protein isoform X2 [Tasmannia lanceolata]|uniref:rubisco methyltransferase family protein isoform X2 n=1 Tax=Tasmannia lanceolata TaxID=3420 RepID=UPI004062A430
MAGASVSFHASLLPYFSQNPSPFRRISTSLTISRKNGINCSVSTTSNDETKTFMETQNIPWGCNVDSLENASKLQKWLSDSGLPPQKMAIERVEIGERGLVALKNIRKGEKLLFVPLSLVISADSEWSCPEAGDVLKRNFVPDWPLLATYLISEASLMDSSRWSNYISALPRQPYSLLYWTLSEIEMYLVASPIRERAIERITDVVGTYNDLKVRIFSKYPHLFPEEVFNIETFKWSFGILFSRLVRLPSMEGKVALVPWADMLNHSSEVETYLDYDKSSSGVVFTTDRSYQPGEQVFISYGKKSNGELLLSYGFVLKEGSNPNDSVDLSMSLNKSDKCYKEKLEVLRKHGLSTPQRFPLQITGWPVELMAYAYLASSPPNMSQHFEEGSGSSDSVVTSPKQANRKVLLKQLATDLCTSERRILFRTQYILRRRLRDMRTGELRALTILNGFRKLFK